MALQSVKDHAGVLYENGKYREAIPRFTRLIAENPRDGRVLFRLALSLYEVGQSEDSLKYWRQLKQIWPMAKQLHLNMGCAHYELERKDLAIREFKKELQVDPASGEALHNLGGLYYRRHQYAKAIPYLAACFALKHSTEHIVAKLAYAYFRTRQLEHELGLYESWLRDHPRDTWCLNNLGAALMQLAQFNRAQLFLEKGLKISPRDPLLLRNLRKVRSIRRKRSLGINSGPARKTGVVAHHETSATTRSSTRKWWAARSKP